MCGGLPSAPRNPCRRPYSSGSKAAAPPCPAPLSRARSRFASLSAQGRSPRLQLLRRLSSCLPLPMSLALPQAAPRPSSRLRHAAIPPPGIAQFRVLLGIQSSSCKVSSRCHGQSKSVDSRVHGVVAKYVLVVCIAQLTYHQSVHRFSGARHLQIQPLKLACVPRV